VSRSRIRPPTHPRPWLLVPFLAGLCGWLHAQSLQSTPRFVTLEGSRRCWQPLTLSFETTLDTHELLHAAQQNPFLDYRLQVRFTHADGETQVVSGFYAADGHAQDTGASAGNVWQAIFSPDRPGSWIWQAEFRTAPGIALEPERAGARADARIDGAFGSFRVLPADPGAPGFWGQGRLQYTGEPYFRFARTGAPFLKNGAGGPENFLAYYEFDGTQGNPLNACLAAPAHLHRYDAHAADFAGDALAMAHLWAGTKGRNILGAIDYLAAQGVNSLYFITNSFHGDGMDVWPWVTPMDKLHFDVSKLAQWQRLFDYMSARGLQIQLVFEESENDQLPVSNGGLGYGLTTERRLYYRELVARFAHHPAVIWIIGDESNYLDEIPVMESMASAIRALDPYRHPIAFHSKHPCYGDCVEPYPSVFLQYQPYFGFPDFEASCFQTSPGGYNTSTVQLREGQALTRKWAQFGDEQSLNATPENLVTNRTRALWGNLMGGGSGVAWYPGNDYPEQYPPGTDICDYFDLTAEDMRAFAGYWTQTRHAIEIFQARLPFTEMRAQNSLASNVGSEDYVFVRPEDAGAGIRAVYAVYRGTGAPTDLSIGPGTHSVDWFDPRTGAGPFADTPLVGPGPQPLVPPSQGVGSDWLAIVRQQ